MKKNNVLLLLIIVIGACTCCGVLAKQAGDALCRYYRVSEEPSPDGRYIAHVDTAACYMSPSDYYVSIGTVREERILWWDRGPTTVLTVFANSANIRTIWEDDTHVSIDYWDSQIYECRYVSGRLREWRDIILSYTGKCEAPHTFQLLD
jgi:hypothetical protein